AYAGEIIGAVLHRNIIRRQREDTRSSAHQINFYQAGVRLEHLILLVQIVLLPCASQFVGRTKEFQNRDYFSAIVLPYLDITFGHRFAVHLENQRLGHDRPSSLAYGGLMLK